VKNKFKKTIMALSNAAMLFITMTPQAYALKSTDKIVQLINALLRIFRGAGIILLVYSVIALVLAIKDENVDSKVQATTQIAVALVCITLASIMRSLSSAAGANLGIK
jgi:cellulose biosynthesis protein BcsQ